MKQHNQDGIKGCVQRRRNRQTGTIVSVLSAKQAGLCDEGGPWVTLCEDHGFLVNHWTMLDALGWAPDPATWCEPCQEKHYGSRGGQ